jgi:hypothetical protein
MTRYTLSTGEVVDIHIAKASCAKCGEPIVRIGDSPWGHGDELVGRRRRHWMGGRFDHDATDDPTAPRTIRR